MRMSASSLHSTVFPLWEAEALSRSCSTCPGAPDTASPLEGVPSCSKWERESGVSNGAPGSCVKPPKWCLEPRGSGGGEEREWSEKTTGGDPPQGDQFNRTILEQLGYQWSSTLAAPTDEHSETDCLQRSCRGTETEDDHDQAEAVEIDLAAETGLLIHLGL